MVARELVFNPLRGTDPAVITPDVRLFRKFLIVHQRIHYVVKERARDRNIAGIVKPLVKTFVY